MTTDDRITQKYLRRWPDSRRARSWAGVQVHIETDNGVWREGGQGYTFAGQPDAWTLPFEDALRRVDHCGPEKRAAFIRAKRTESIMGRPDWCPPSVWDEAGRLVEILIGVNNASGRDDLGKMQENVARVLIEGAPSSDATTMDWDDIEFLFGGYRHARGNGEGERDAFFKALRMTSEGKPKHMIVSPIVAMTEAEQVCFDRGMEQWQASTKRPDLSEEDRVKGALLAYQRQAYAFTMIRSARRNMLPEQT